MAEKIRAACIRRDGSVYGTLMMLIGLLTLVPLCICPFYPQDSRYFSAFLAPGGLSALAGLLLWWLAPPAKLAISRQENAVFSSLTVLFAWFYGILIGALPFVLGGQLSLLDALFEAVSGWTTTGLSVMDVSVTPHIYLFHRSFMQFCGGLGFVMMMVMLVQKKQSMELFSAEGHPDKLMPNLRKTAQVIFKMYLIFLIVGTIAYVAVGMPLFDSINHTMCALSTGGFSTRLGSIGEYNSFAIELVTVILMLIGTTNFAVLLLGAHRRWKQFFRVSEVRFMFLLLAIFTPMLTFDLMSEMHMGAFESLRRALLDGVSALSTTGYSSMAYGKWPAFSLAILILMMLIGGGIGSTAGGLKLTRAYLLLRMAGIHIRKRLSSPRRVCAPSYYKAQGPAPIDNALLADTTGFACCYFFLFVVGSLLLTLAAHCSLTEAMFEFSSALGTVGLSIGLTAPGTSGAVLLIEMAGMLLGRLEIFPIVAGIYALPRFVFRKNKWLFGRMCG
ncbi:MAG: TrkH family potassium uptake protein [Faecalibacterium sp.]|jgi:trk system potassium uptake protein TrkH|nr:TrkH family potassium uptake protein [Faecalibacterium sp.]